MWEDSETAAAAKPEKADLTAEGAEGAEKPEKKKSEPKDEVKLSKKDHDAREARIRELESENRFWAGKARASAAPEPEPDEAEPQEEDDDEPEVVDATAESFTEALTAEGMAALVKRGLMTKKDARKLAEKNSARMFREVERLVDQRIDGAQKRMTNDAALVAEYPELRDTGSEFYKLTAANLKEMVADDPSLRKSPGALKMAARLAKAEIEKQSGQGRETEREKRIRAQAGERSGQGGEDEGGDDLSPMQKKMLAKINADGGVQVSEEAFKKRAKAGVNMHTRMEYRPGSVDWK